MAKKNRRFVIKAVESGFIAVSTYVLVDKQTGVNYLYASGGYGGGLTVLLDATGKPIVTPVIEEE